ncbi:class I SAM-dependent methyltransferase [Aureitalea sp. L0-47]|uniref:class I SAM-dependent methyltransferase n=1 Tax=Aureitalea sp. L0-47 TaxID=2816962 RepID=UPI002238EDC0|nr:class I SAM-dependent methyltransferase [Aureitalea sp. L0-47]MCW5520683.1 class I SAM-dependent methyltransferase [Aureitalea sp. L0-47]
MDDIFGQALLDYHRGNYTEDLRTETSISEPDEMPLPYLFRSYEEMPEIEQTALDESRGDILEVGCGAGNHGLYLQKKGLKVTAIDESPGAIEVSRDRGIRKTENVRLLEFEGGPFDTILLLMNGTGIFARLEFVPNYLKHLKSLLKPGGQVLVDGSDLQYMYDRTEEGAIWVPADRYYGELDFIISYKGQSTPPFPWLYLDERLLEEYTTQAGFEFEIVVRGENFDYLARLTL